MRIGFDVSQTSEDMAGCGFFSKQIISHLLEIDKINKYILYPVFYNYRHPNYKNAYSVAQDNAISLFTNHSWKQVNEMWSGRDKDQLLSSPDIVHSNNFSFPFGLEKAKTIMTIYDLGYLDCPEYTTEENRLVCFNGALNASLYADHVVTISNFSKNSFLKFFPYYPEDKVSVVHLGNRPTLQQVKDPHRIKNVMDKFGLSESFWLGVGTIEPRKNYRLLLEAYSQLVQKNTNAKPLYIAGGKGWMESDIQLLVNSLKIEDKVKFLGYVTDEELSVLYSKCFAFIYPSLYEGFGLPVLEAMNCGSPVITSKGSSLPEVVEEAALMINPKESFSLLQAMERINNNPDLRHDLSRASMIQAKKFSWNYAANKMLSIYDKVMGD